MMMKTGRQRDIRWLAFCRKLPSVMFLLMVTACGQLAPANIPAQLMHTPGPSITITTNSYRTSAFTIWYPPAWRVVSSAAFVEPAVVLVAPDERALILAAVGQYDETIVPPLADMPLRREEAEVKLSPEVTLRIVGVASEHGWEQFAPILNQVISSAVPPQN